ncbi:Uncharacterized protein SCF082_LOCUS15960 [Durusdinium trenchii]|uniref:Uncharacterized protein n=1 Tax=Durusdinium trenchii TaxID=1381693 RepID=A0ABP0K9Q1_9DINO
MKKLLKGVLGEENLRRVSGRLGGRRSANIKSQKLESEMGMEDSMEDSGGAVMLLPETGLVEFLHNVDEAKEVSLEVHRPVFLMFQEIPGCSVCTDFGKNVLSNEMIRDFIESEFVPCVINNRGTHPVDVEALRMFNEPALNNPVVRFIDDQGNDLIPRKDGVWDALGMLQRMIQAQQAFDAAYKPPMYIRWLVQSLQLEHPLYRHHFETLILTCECYWSGEAVAGAVAGVVSTEAAWMDNSEECVRVVFDTREVSLLELVKQVRDKDPKMGLVPCTRAQETELHRHEYRTLRKRPIAPIKSYKENKYHLKTSGQFTVAQIASLLPQQLARINACIAANEGYVHLLSPTQTLPARTLRTRTLSRRHKQPTNPPQRGEEAETKQEGFEL